MSFLSKKPWCQDPDVFSLLPLPHMLRSRNRSNSLSAGSSPKEEPFQVAAWRIRVHAARRRTMLTVWVVVRFMGCNKLKRAPRLLRMDSLGSAIPLILGEGEFLC